MMTDGRLMMYSIPVNQQLITTIPPDDVDTSEIPATDYMPTDELPEVHIMRMPPSYEPREHYVRNGAAGKWLHEHSNIPVSHYDPRDTIMRVNDGTANTGRIGTRIIPLDDLSYRYPVGAMNRMIDNRNNGIASAIGHDYMMESDELTQGETTVYAKAF